jgi:hypothetical protein
VTESREDDSGHQVLEILARSMKFEIDERREGEPLLRRWGSAVLSDAGSRKMKA